MQIQQYPWAIRVAKIEEEDYPYEELDFASDPTDLELLNEIREAEDMKVACEYWNPEDEDLELDDCGNPIVDNEKRCWAARLKKFSSSSPPEAIQALLRKPFPSILLGAALCAGQPYLLWNIRTFLHTHLNDSNAWLRCSFGILLNSLCTSNGTVVQDATTMDVLFHLAVEPFALMNE